MHSSFYPALGSFQWISLHLSFSRDEKQNKNLLRAELKYPWKRLLRTQRLVIY